MSETTSVNPNAVFINVPFDAAYEPLFITLVGVITFLDYTPHCVLEVRETGEGRLQRIYELMRSCRISVHDMSRIGAPARFNMPFELGLACSLKLEHPQQYEVLVFDSKPYRMDRRLSDYKGRDLYIHYGTRQGMIAALLNAFQAPPIDRSAFRRAFRELYDSAEKLKREAHAATVFQPYLFSALVTNAVRIRADVGLLPP